MKVILKKLGPKDIRALKVGAVGVAAIVLFLLITGWAEQWAGVRRTLAEKRAMLKAINPSEAKQAGLFSIVPVFEMPEAEEKQKFLFRDRLKEQLKKAGIKTKPLQILAASRARGGAGYKLLRVKCSSEKCKFGQILDLLANLKDNPYLAGIEELKIKSDPKKKGEFKLDITVSTFTR